ncbi:protein AKNAD1 [Molossus nigricans]
MDEADFSELTTLKQQEDSPYDGHFSQIKLYSDRNFPWKSDILDVSDHVTSAVGAPRGKAARGGPCRHTDPALTLGETAVQEKCDKGQQCTPNLHIPAHKGDPSKSHSSDILQHRLSKEEFLKGQSINCDALPEISRAERLDEAIVKNILLRYIKSSWPQEQTPALTGQLSPTRDGGSGSGPSRSPATAEESTPELEEPVAAGDGSLPESSNFLTTTKSPSNKQKGCQGQTWQKLQPEKTRSGHGFKYDQVHYQFSDFSNVASQVKIPKKNITDKLLPVDEQASFPPELGDRLALVQDLLDSVSGSHCVEREEQKRKTADPSRRTEESSPVTWLVPSPRQALRTRNSCLTRVSPPLLTREPLVFMAQFPAGHGTSQNPRHIFSILPSVNRRGRVLVKIRILTRLELNGRYFIVFPKCGSHEIGARESHTPADKTAVVSALMALTIQFLETMEPAIHIHQEQLTGTESERSLFKLSATSQKDPSSSSSYIFQKISQGKKMCQKLKEQTEQLKTKVQEFSKSIAQDSPCHVQDKRLVLEKLQAHFELLEQEFVANKEKHLTWKQQAHKYESPAASEFDPERKVEGEILNLEMLLEDVREKMDVGKHASARPLPASSPSILDGWPPTSSPPSDEEEKHGEERPREDRLWVFPIILQEAAPHPAALRSPGRGPCCWPPASGVGLQSREGEAWGTGVPNSPRDCHREPLTEFHYRYNTPGQNYFNHTKGGAFVQLCFLNENKNSSPSCSKPNWIYSQRANSKSSQDEHDLLPGKESLKASGTSSSDLATPLPHFHSCRISGSKFFSNVSSIKETKSEGLDSSLDHALRTATILRETTDQMIRTIAEDLAKLQRWRNQLKY